MRSPTSSSPRSSRQAKLRRYVSSDHFSVDGTLLEAWASHKSFKPKDGPPPRRRRRAATPRCSLARPEALERHARVDDRSRGAAVSQEQQHRGDAVLLGASVDGEPQRADRRRRADHRRRLRRAGHRARDARPAPDHRTGDAPSRATRATTPAGSSPTPARLGFTPHVAPEHHPATLRDRRAHHPTRRPRGESCGSANGSRNPSAGSRPSAEAASSATSAEQRNRAWFKITAAVYNLIRITALDTTPA